METYTWEVMPQELQAGTVVEQVAREYEWTLEQMEENRFTYEENKNLIPHPMPSNLNLILTLSRVSNLPTVWTNCLQPGLLINPWEKYSVKLQHGISRASFDWGFSGG